jgi:hypothetical protein
VRHKVSQPILSPKQCLNHILLFASLKFGKKGEKIPGCWRIKIDFGGYPLRP